MSVPQVAPADACAPFGMKFGITSKLFLAISLACLLVIVVMGVAGRVSFERGFIDYLKTQSGLGSALLAKELETTYARHGSWDFLRNNQSEWTELIRSASVNLRPDGTDVPAPPDMTHPPPIGMPDGGPPPGDFPGVAPPGALGAAQDNKDGRFREPRPPFALLDAQLNRVVGNGPPPPPDAAQQSIKVDGKVVGWLVVSGPPSLLYEADRRFQRQQVRATWVIVGLSAVLSGVFAIILARALLAPVRRLVAATHSLATGDYATRVPAAGSDELHRLATDFNRLAVALQNAERTRRDFIADISHELRTPLAVLRGELEAIQDGVRRLDNSTLDSLQSEVAMLSQLTDDLYELALADIGELSFEMVQVDVSSLVSSAAESFRERLAAKNVTLNTIPGATPALMAGDPYRLTQLIKNLLENSLRYTDPGGKVEVVVTAGSDGTRIDVQDSFPSVPESMLPRIFDRLFRVDSSRSRRSGGAGLGLALCQHIVHAHGGTIEARHSALGGLWIMIRFAVSRKKDD